MRLAGDVFGAAVDAVAGFFAGGVLDLAAGFFLGTGIVGRKRAARRKIAGFAQRGVVTLDNLATIAVLPRDCIVPCTRPDQPPQNFHQVFNITRRMYTLSDFDFELPQELIAQTPLAERSASRLLHVAQPIADRAFADIVDLLAPGDLLVFNDTRVLKARFFGVKETGGKVEVLIERVIDQRHVHAQVRASKSPLPGMKIRLADAFDAIVGERVGEFYELQFPDDVFELIEAHGRLPLPPYITHDADAYDETRYQTVYAKIPGAVAAPTAGLHFDEALLARLQAKGIGLAYITLHVGAGTFQPVRNENLAEHNMHSEWYTISQQAVDAVRAAQAAGRDVVAVGTTSMRALESASQDGELKAGSADTRLFITPGYTFKTVSRLITNFHLPKSTLLMLVSAFAGYDVIRAAYQHAIAQRYRFFSYGDAMFLTRTPPC
jgi:S-adenosylmethionine:tRNA ribosyltransferase-isomerase